MNNLLTRRNALVLGVLVPAAILVGLMAWLFIPRSDPAGPVSAQQAFEDACADATPVSHVDLTTEGTATYNSDPYTWRRVIRVAPNAEHHLTTAPSSSEKAEMIIVESPSDGTRSDGSGGSVALYTRSADDAGVWGDWSIENANIPPSSTSTGRSSSGPEHFCGMETSRFTSFEYVGTETVGSVDTKHFRASRTPAGAPSGDYQWVDYWIDLNGVPIKVTESYSVAGDQMETTTTYSGWGETNVIATPVTPVQANPTPTPEVPTATPAPTAEPALTPTPEPTATPRPTNTPAPGAWLDPDPSTITLRGEWRVFRVRGTESINLKINVLGPGRKGTVLHSDDRWPPPVEDPCRSASTATHSKDVGDSFRLVGCRSGKAVVQLLDTSNALIREYVIRVRR